MIGHSKPVRGSVDGMDQADIYAFSGQSLRFGVAQDLLVNDTVAIMRPGGWKTVGVFARYLEKARAI